MQLKKLQVPVNIKKKKIQKPKLRKRIVVKPKLNQTIPDIKMPEISGVKGGLGNASGGLGGGAGGLGDAALAQAILGWDAPMFPVDLIARAKPGKVNLLWTPVEADSYDVFRSSQSSGPYDLIGSVDGNVFVDTAVTTGETYFYVVQAVTGIGNSENSNEVEVLVPAGRRRR